MRPVSNAHPGEPGEVPDNEVNAHPGVTAELATIREDQEFLRNLFYASELPLPRALLSRLSIAPVVRRAEAQRGDVPSTPKKEVLEMANGHTSGLLPEVVQEKRQDARPSEALTAVVTDYGYNLIGSSSGDVLFKSTGWNIAVKPTIVICQPRQSDNIDHGWPDQFAIQVIETGTTFVRFRVRRIDGGSSGWGQNLRVDIIVIN